MNDPIVELASIDLSEVKRDVGARSYERGRAYAGAGNVLTLEWEAEDRVLTGLVSGTTVYTARAYFDRLDSGLAFEEGECTCPVGYDCKHVAAIAIAATSEAGGARGAGARSAPRPAEAPAPAWERSLRDLVGAPEAPEGARPLAIELSLRLDPGRSEHPRLLARLMRPGARGGWVNGSLSWNGLDSWHVREANLRSDHLRFAHDLLAVHSVQESQRGHSYYYGYGYSRSDGRTLDLTECDSPRLWPLLEEASRIGVRLIHTSPGLGELATPETGEVQLDVRGDDAGGSVVGALLCLEEGEAERLQPLRFLGASGHGVVCAERPDDREPEDGEEPDLADRRLCLVRLAKPVPEQLRRMLLEGEQLEVPAAERERFAVEFGPALGRVATIVSSDGSFEPPRVSAPELVLRASYGQGHSLDLAWEWAYEIGERTVRTPLGGGTEAGHRDRRAEQAALAAAELGDIGLERFGLLDEAGRPAATGAVTLAGVETMRLTTEALPLLRERGIELAVKGEPADYRDVGDSLEIGVSTAEIAGESDWFDLGVTVSVEGRAVPLAEVFVALARGESHLLLDDGAHISLADARLESLRALIAEAQELADAPADSLRISCYQAGLWAELEALGVVTEQAEAWRRRVGALLDLERVGEHDPPAGFTAELRPYQREGFGWLATLRELELGGILADDMGLGKTLQALALFCRARELNPGCAPFLVVAPASVVSNWAAEAARFAPELTVNAITDTLNKSGRTIEEVASADVVVTTYTLLRLDAEAYRQVRWEGLVLDEAQAVKNHQSKTYRCVRELETPFKLALTGTPMENNLGELWSLLSIAAPGLFPDPQRFAEQYSRPIERGGDGERLARLRRRIKPLVMRRSKELVAADLPSKQEQTLEVELHPRHRKLYDTRLQRERQKILGLIDDFDRNRFTILRSLTLLRQLSLHPALTEEGQDRVPCAKLAVLVEQLEEVVGGGHRALVFSQFTGFLAKVRERLDEAGIDYCYLDGSTRKRERVIERFKQGSDPVFLISLKAGGSGLNLTEADYCFLLDPWWNPAIEAQAIDRTHRIGQTRPVLVYRMIAKETIEEKVAALARRKAELFSGVMDDGDLFSGGITAEDIRSLLDEPAAKRGKRSKPLAEAA